MALYSWKGIDLGGALHQGLLFAHSLEDLKLQLLKNDVGLVFAIERKITRPTSHVWQRFLFHLSALLEAHMPLHDAVILITLSAKNPLMRAIYEDIARLISEGMPLSHALKIHAMGDEMTYSLLTIGEKTGNLVDSLAALVEYAVQVAQFKEKLRSALRGPFITGLFFLVTVFSVFLFIIPRFERYFAAYQAEMPWLTKAIFRISSFVRSQEVLWLLAVCGLLGVVLLHLLRTEHGKKIKDRLLFLAPCISGYSNALYQIRILRMLGMQVKAGIPVYQALIHCRDSFENSVVKCEIIRCIQALEGGRALSDAWKESLFTHSETETLMKFGEVSGKLGSLCEHAAALIRKNLYTKIDTAVALVQPVLLLILGALIAALIFAVYMPVISFSFLIQGPMA